MTNLTQQGKATSEAGTQTQRTSSNESAITILAEIRDEVYVARDILSENNPPAMIGIFITSMIFGNLNGALWVYFYLTNTVIGDEKILLWEYILGNKYGIGLVSSELLFVVVARYILAFGFGATSLFVLLWIVDYIRKAFRKIEE